MALYEHSVGLSPTASVEVLMIGVRAGQLLPNILEECDGDWNSCYLLAVAAVCH